MDQIELRTLREFCPRLLCHWPDGMAEQFVERCGDFSVTTLCWIWDWLLNQIKGINPPSSIVALTLANFLLKKLPRSYKIPSFAALRLLHNLKESDYNLTSCVAVEIANRNPFTPPGSLAKFIVEALHVTSPDPAVSGMVSSLSYLLCKTVNNFHFRTSFKAIESILEHDSKYFIKYFMCDNFVSLIHFTVSLPFHRTLSHFYSSIHFMNCLKLNQPIEIYSLSTQNHAIFIHLINWSEYLSDMCVSHLFYTVHTHYIESFSGYYKTTPAHDRDKLCFTVLILALFCRNLKSQSYHMYDAFYRILNRSNALGLFSLLPGDKDPIHVTKASKFLNKIFSTLLDMIDFVRDDMIFKPLWSSVEILLDHILPTLDLHGFLLIVIKYLRGIFPDFENNAFLSISYILEIFQSSDKAVVSDLSYNTIIPNLIFKMFRVGDLKTFFQTLTRKIPFYLFLNCELVHSLFKCGYYAQDISMYMEPIFSLMLVTEVDPKFTVTLRLMLSSLLLSYDTKDNATTKSLLTQLSKYVPRLSFQVKNSIVEDTSLYTLVFSLFMIIRKVTYAFSYSQSSELCTFNYIDKLIEFAFDVKSIVDLNSYFSYYQLALAEHALINISFYYAYKIHRNQDFNYISLVNEFGQSLYDLCYRHSTDQFYNFYLIYITNPHLLELYGLTLPPELSLFIRAFTEESDLPVVSSVVKYFVGVNGINLCRYLQKVYITNENFLGLSKILNILVEPLPEILERVLKIFADRNYVDTKCLFSPFFLNKSLRTAILTHFVNELLLPIDLQLCDKCNGIIEAVKSLRLTNTNFFQPTLFQSVISELYFELISKSIIEMTKYENIPDTIDAIIMYIMFYKQCKFLLPLFEESKCHLCIENKRKNAITKTITGIREYPAIIFFESVTKYKILENGASKLLNISFDIDDSLLEINDFLDSNPSEYLCSLSYLMIRYIAKISREQLDEDLTVDFLIKTERLPLDCVVNMEYNINSINTLLYYLRIYLNKVGVIYDGPVPHAVKTIVKNKDIAEELLLAAREDYPNNSPPNVLLNLFTSDCIFKLCKSDFNASTRLKSPLYDIMICSFKESLHFICENPHLIENGKLYIFLCKIACMIYDYMRILAVKTTGFVNIANLTLINELLITLSNVASILQYIVPEDGIKHSYLCIYSLLNYSSEGGGAQTMRLINLWINSIPLLIKACKSWFKILPNFSTIDLLLDVVKLLRNKKIMNSTKRYIPLILTFVVKHTKELTSKPTNENATFIESIKQKIQIAVDECGGKITQEWFTDLPIQYKNYLKIIGVKPPTLENGPGGPNRYIIP